MQNQGSKVGFVLLSVFSVEGGIQSYLKDVLTAYCENPNAPPADVFTLRDHPEVNNPLNKDKITFHYFDNPNPMLGRLNLTLQLIKYLTSQPYRHVICGHVLLLPLVGPLCQIFNVPYTAIIYGKEVWQTTPWIQRRALQKATGIWGNSRYSRDLACAANGLDPKRFHMLPCIVNDEVFTPGLPRPELVEQYGLQGNRVLMTVARLWSGDIYKGVDVTIRALPKILNQFPKVKYLVVGRGDDQPRLAQMAKDLGVAEHVVFAGFVADDLLVEHYRLADAYVMPSKEGFGIVYLEAMACGVPTLSGNDDGSADPLQDGRVGWRVPYRDPDVVAAACIEILRGEDQRCNPEWLRQQTLAQFSPQSLKDSLSKALAVI